MIGILVAPILIGTSLLAEPVKTRVVAASMFKNGYAVVLREASLSASGDTTVEALPAAALGTMWITATAGITLDSIVMTNVESTKAVNTASINEILAANIGKKMVVSGKDISQHGKLLSVDGDILIFETQLAEGQPTKTVAIQKTGITKIQLEEQGVTTRDVKSLTRTLQVKSKGGAGKLLVLSLERGVTWAPAYSIDITDKKKLTVVGKATILNDLTDLAGIEAKLITGFPNLPYLEYRDPFSSGESVDAFTASMFRTGANFMGQSAAPGAAGFASNAMTADKRRSFDDAFDMSQIGTGSNEDLFFYRIPNVTLKRADRGYYVFMRTEAEYEHVYTWDIADPIVDSTYQGTGLGLGDVWHSLKFKNSSGQPFTSAPVVTLQNGEILGQDMVAYTSAGATALVRITKALDVRAELVEEETTRERDAIKQTNYQRPYDLVTISGTMEVKNRKAETITIKIEKILTGDVITAEGSPKITKTAKGLRAVNSQSLIQWEQKVESGKTLTLKYSYKVYVATQGR